MFELIEVRYKKGRSLPYSVTFTNRFGSDFTYRYSGFEDMQDAFVAEDGIADKFFKDLQFIKDCIIDWLSAHTPASEQVGAHNNFDMRIGPEIEYDEAEHSRRSIAVYDPTDQELQELSAARGYSWPKSTVIQFVEIVESENLSHDGSRTDLLDLAKEIVGN